MKRHLRPSIQNILIGIMMIQIMFSTGLNIPLTIINLILLVINFCIVSKYGKDIYE